METFFTIFLGGGGGGGGEFDTSREITGKILRGKKNIIGNSRLPVGTIRKNCRSTRLGLILRVVYISKRTYHMQLIIDFRLQCFYYYNDFRRGGGGGGSERNVQKTFPVAKSIRESSLEFSFHTIFIAEWSV